jgi:hypothetical protein
MDIEHMIADAAMILLYWQQNRILALQGPPMQPSNWRERLGKMRRYWPMLVMTILVAAMFAQPYLSSLKMQRADLRLAPFAETAFFDSLSNDQTEFFRMMCFSGDPSSCTIAAQYREQFRDHWMPDLTWIQDGEPNFKGILILVPSDDDHPTGAVELAEAFLRVGIEARIKPLTSTSPMKLKPHEFAVWVGGQP